MYNCYCIQRKNLIGCAKKIVCLLNSYTLQIFKITIAKSRDSYHITTVTDKLNLKSSFISQEINSALPEYSHITKCKIHIHFAYIYGIYLI